MLSPALRVSESVVLEMAAGPTSIILRAINCVAKVKIRPSRNENADRIQSAIFLTCVGSVMAWDLQLQWASFSHISSFPRPCSWPQICMEEAGDWLLLLIQWDKQIRHSRTTACYRYLFSYLVLLFSGNICSTFEDGFVLSFFLVKVSDLAVLSRWYIVIVQLK